MMIANRRRVAGAVAVGAALSLAGVARATPASGLFYERSVMQAADARCRLFPPEIAQALNASRLQARGAALRGGLSETDLAAAADRAKTAAYGVACTAPDLITAADRVKAAFAGYAKISWMSFPGELSRWDAIRKPTAPVVDHRPVDGPLWRLSEPGVWDGGGQGAVIFGLTADPNQPTVIAADPGLTQASSAFFIVRDPEKAALPLIDPRHRDLISRAPPRTVTRGFVASVKQAAPASLLPGGRGQGALFAFPPAAAQALAGLDPREAVTVEFVFPDRPSRRAVFEVGDFAAGRAFLATR